MLNASNVCFLQNIWTAIRLLPGKRRASVPGAASDQAPKARGGETGRMVSESLTIIVAEAFASLIPLILIAGYIVNGERKRRLQIIFILLASMNALLLWTDILEIIFWEQRRTTLQYTMDIAGYFAYWMMLGCFSWYVSETVSRYIRVKRWPFILSWGLAATGMITWSLSLYNHTIAYYDSDGNFMRGPYYVYGQIPGFLITVLAAGVIFSYSRYLEKSESFALYLYIFVPVAAALIRYKVTTFPILYMSMTATVLVIYVNVHMRRDREYYRQEVLLAQNRISIMLSQVQPHFIYNCLNAIYYLCDKDPEEAQEAISSFSDYLRGNLDSLSHSEKIPFAKEMEHVMCYLKLEKMRFGDELNVEEDIEEDEFLIPAITVQPLVENAVKHGVTTNGGGTVYIGTRREGKEIVITVRDDGKGYDVNGSPTKEPDGRRHVGLENVRERIRLMCGGSLEVKSAPGQGTEAVIRLPR